jgi:P-type conjugative transfer protein TrbJ
MIRCVVLVCVLVPSASWAQFAVIDVSAIAQMLTQYSMQVQQYGQQVQQTYNQYQQIRNELTMIQQATQNLQHFTLDNAAALLSLSQQLQGKLAQARMIGYEANLVVSQAQSVYPRITGVLSGQDLAATQRQWAAAQREAAAVALQVQAMQADHAATMARIAELVHASSQTQGNLDSQQALAQGQGIIATQLEGVQGQLATQARLQALRTLEEASMKEATSQALQAARAPLDLSARPAGHILSLSGE